MRQSVLRSCLAVVLALSALPCLAAPAKPIYLTFDADMTPGMRRRLDEGKVKCWFDHRIVDYLRRQHVPAVVFVSGLFAEVYPDLVKELADDPLFRVGVHGYSHAAYTASCYGLPVLRDDSEKREDALHAKDAVAKVAGREPELFRYPGLCHDAHDDDIVAETGLRVDTPDVISGDSFNRNARAIVKQVAKQAKTGGTILFHFGGPNAPATYAALTQVVPLLRARGYEFAAK